MKPYNTISASQMKTAEWSPRRWWFEKRRALPYRRKSYFGFGTTLSECLERYLLAEQNEGLDVAFPDSYQPMAFGRPERGVGPQRWDWRLERPETEGPLIRQLVAEAVEKGFLRRSADAWVEWELPRIKFGGEARLMGFGDLAYPDEDTILDHKSTKARKWIMSRPKMKRDIQLILYAAVLLEHKREKGCEPKEITVGHIAYVKDGSIPYGERVELKTTTVTPAEIDARMEEIHELATSMNVWADETDFLLVPCGGKVCANKYGGCPYLTICGGEETPEEYEKRFDKAESMLDTLSKRAKGESARKETTMGNRLLDQLKKGKRPATAVKPPAPATPPPAEETQAPAPWRSDGCPSCGGSGWTAKGDPCRICLGLTKYPMSEVTLTGPFEYEHTPNPIPPSAPAAEKPQEPAQEPVVEEAPAEAPAEETPPAPAEEPVAAASDAGGMDPHETEPERQEKPAATAPAKRRGRPSVTTVTLTIKTSDAALLERFAQIAERLS
jgi:hypothetical protein